MYKVNYYDDRIKKSDTYEKAYLTALSNGNTKWANYYFILKEKFELCFDIENIVIDMEDINNMKFDIFSNGILLDLYRKCKQDGTLNTEGKLTISNDTTINEEIIYNILKAEWLIDERLLDDDELERRENYYQSMIDVSEDSQDIRIQFRNKLFAYFLKRYQEYKKQKEDNSCKVLQLKK